MPDEVKKSLTEVSQNIKKHWKVFVPIAFLLAGIGLYFSYR